MGIKIKLIAAIMLTMTLFGCENRECKDPLPSWNDTDVKREIVEFLEVKSVDIPVEDRVAVFDMDGTIMCETPLWCEMAVAAQKMADILNENTELESNIAYQYAERLSKDASDEYVRSHWVLDGKNYLDTIILKAFKGVDHEEYVDYSRNYLENTCIPKYEITYAEAFYQPMMELIEYLKEKEFDLYIVSGSKQGILWSVLPQNIGLDRQHLIGTCQTLEPHFYGEKGASYEIQETVNLPKNDMVGKSVNIYNRLGKIPVLAVGNTIDDFGMFRMTSTSKYPHLSILINHDDAEREFEYEPYHGAPMVGWEDTLKVNGWLRADMKSEFKVMWKVDENKHN